MESEKTASLLLCAELRSIANEIERVLDRGGKWRPSTEWDHIRQRHLAAGAKAEAIVESRRQISGSALFH
jgi:hypothetical protein